MSIDAGSIFALEDFYLGFEGNYGRGTVRAQRKSLPSNKQQGPAMHPNQYASLRAVGDRLLPLKEVCERLHCSRSTVYSLFNSKRLQPVKLNSRTFVRLSELNAFIASLSSDGGIR